MCAVPDHLGPKRAVHTAEQKNDSWLFRIRTVFKLNILQTDSFSGIEQNFK